MYGLVNSFKNKLKLFEQTLESNNFVHFPSCKEIMDEMENFEGCCFADHIQYLEKIIVEFDQRFEDFIKIEKDVLLFTNPLGVKIENVNVEFQMELCELQADVFLNTRIENGSEFFNLLGNRFPKLKNFGLKMSSMMGSTYLCESAFSTMKLIKSKYRSSLSDSSLLNAMRLATTTIEIDINNIVKEKYNKK